MIGIYKITSPTKKVYIGQSIDIKRRFLHYKLLDCKAQKKLYNSFVKYKVEKHKFEVLQECEMHELNDIERYYQDVYSAVGKGGLNLKLTNTSDKSGRLSDETKKKIGEANRNPSAETRRKLSEAQKGKVFSIERRQKMSESFKNPSIETRRKIGEAQKGRKRSDETKNKMSEAIKKIILNIETGIFYFGAKEAAESVGITEYILWNKLSGRTKNKTNLIYV